MRHVNVEFNIFILRYHACTQMKINKQGRFSSHLRLGIAKLFNHLANTYMLDHSDKIKINHIGQLTEEMFLGTNF
jgi:hypothetical protein